MVARLIIPCKFSLPSLVGFPPGSLVSSLLRSLFPDPFLLFNKFQSCQSPVFVLVLLLFEIVLLSHLELLSLAFKLLLYGQLLFKLDSPGIFFLLAGFVHLRTQLFRKLRLSQLVLLPLVLADVDEVIHGSGDAGPGVLIRVSHS